MDLLYETLQFYKDIFKDFKDKIRNIFKSLYLNSWENHTEQEILKNMDSV